MGFPYQRRHYEIVANSYSHQMFVVHNGVHYGCVEPASRGGRCHKIL